MLPPLNELLSMRILLGFNVYIMPSEKKIMPKATLGFKSTISKKMIYYLGQVDLNTYTSGVRHCNCLEGFKKSK